MNTILSHLFNSRNDGIFCNICGTLMMGFTNIKRVCLNHSMNYHLRIGTYMQGETTYMWVYSDGNRTYNFLISTDILRINIDIIIKSFEHILLLECETNIMDILTKYSDYMPISSVMNNSNVREMSEELFLDTMRKELIAASYKCMRCDCTFDGLPSIDVMSAHHCIVELAPAQLNPVIVN